MVRISILTIAALATYLPSAIAHPANAERQAVFGCGTHPTEEYLNITRQLAHKEAKYRASSKGKVSLDKSPKNLTIDTYFHVVAKDKTVDGGYVSQKAINDQLAVLNDNFAPKGVQFRMKGVDWTINAKWSQDGNELAMKKALRKGPYKALNIYFQTDLSGNLGYCYFPTKVTQNSEDFWIDGCTILHTTVPGGSLKNFNAGKTTTHEVGHWFGLQHTFEGGCEGVGDEMADTPAQASSSSGCPIGRDSCPGQEGLDPIHNYMDYSYDSCYEEFTPNQAVRMLSWYNEYRA